MEIYQVKVFLEVARHLSFTEAADVLNLTQPAVSAKIKSLESELGVSLFHRLGRRIELTKIGTYLLSKGPDLVDLESQIVSGIEEIKQGKSGKTRIGSTPRILDEWLPKFLFEYRCKYPSLTIETSLFESLDLLYGAIVSKSVDLGFADLSFSGLEGIAETTIDTVRYGVVVKSEHGLAKTPWASVRHLLDEPWVLPTPNVATRKIFENRLAELGLSLADFARLEIADSPGLVKQYLVQGSCFGFAAHFEYESECYSGLLKWLPLEEFALPGHLFLVAPKSLEFYLKSVKSASSIESTYEDPIEHFIYYAFRSTQDRYTSTIQHKKPEENGRVDKILRARSPHFLGPRNGTSSASPKVFKLAIGIQNTTIQTATAGIMMQRLGLLEHFLPRTGRYRDVDYQIQWLDHTSGAPIVQGLQSGLLQIGILGDYPLLLSAAQTNVGSTTIRTNRLVSFVATSPSGSGNDVIVPKRSPLAHLEDLEGRIIAVPHQSAAHGMILRLLHHAHLLETVTLTSINKLNLHNIPTHSVFVDGYAYFAPFHEVACCQGNFRKLFEESVSTLPTFHGIVVQEALAEEHPDIVVAYLKALLAAQHWYKTTTMAPHMLSQWVGLDTAIVTRTLGQLDGESVLFLPETRIRNDWLQEHVESLATIPDHDILKAIDLNQWVDDEFLNTALRSM